MVSVLLCLFRTPTTKCGSFSRRDERVLHHAGLQAYLEAWGCEGGGLRCFQLSIDREKELMLEEWLSKRTLGVQTFVGGWAPAAPYILARNEFDVQSGRNKSHKSDKKIGGTRIPAAYLVG